MNAPGNSQTLGLQNGFHQEPDYGTPAGAGESKQPKVQMVIDGLPVSVVSRMGETALRAYITERVQPGVAYTTFHFPKSGVNVLTTDHSDWATNCPEYKVAAIGLVRMQKAPV